MVAHNASKNRGIHQSDGRRTKSAISVIIPTYNPSPEGLNAAVGSVLSQDVGPIELIVVDDGSSIPVASEYFADPRVSVLRRRNGGVSAARQAGLEVARGEWVAFLDDDDTWLPGSLSRRLEILKTQPLDVVGLLSAPIGPTPKGESPWFALRDLREGDVRILSRAEYCELQMKHGYFLLQGGLFRRKVLISLGGFDPNLFASEDQDLLFRILHHDRLIFLQEPTFRRIRQGMTSKAENLDKIALSSHQMVRKQIEDVRRYWTPSEAAAFWAFHDSCARRRLRSAKRTGDSTTVWALREELSMRKSPRNIYALVRSFA